MRTAGSCSTFAAATISSNIRPSRGKSRFLIPGANCRSELSRAYSGRLASTWRSEVKYPIVVHKDSDSDYGVTVPDLPGCHSVWGDNGRSDGKRPKSDPYSCRRLADGQRARALAQQRGEPYVRA